MNDQTAFEKLLGFPIAGITLSRILTALLVFLLCRVAILLILRAVDRVFDRLSAEKTLTSFLRSLTRVLLWFVALLIIADSLGIPIASVLAIFGVLGLAVSLSLQNALSNLISGLTLLITKPFRERDFIEFGGMSGEVTDLSMTYTRIQTADNKMILVPNSQVTAAQITNYTMQATRRIELTLNAPYEVDPADVERALQEAISATPLVLPSPASFARLSGFGDSARVYTLRVWVRTPDYWPVYYDLTAAVQRAFAQHGIDMPFARLDVRVAPPRPQ